MKNLVDVSSFDTARSFNTGDSANEANFDDLFQRFANRTKYLKTETYDKLAAASGIATLDASSKLVQAVPNRILESFIRAPTSYAPGTLVTSSTSLVALGGVTFSSAVVVGDIVHATVTVRRYTYTSTHDSILAIRIKDGDGSTLATTDSIQLTKTVGDHGMYETIQVAHTIANAGSSAALQIMLAVSNAASQATITYIGFHGTIIRP